jgi:hypothetical protein
MTSTTNRKKKLIEVAIPLEAINIATNGGHGDQLLLVARFYSPSL